MSDDSIRLNKRVADVLGCSRTEAERYIAGGWVTVDGSVIEEPGARVTEAQAIALLPGAIAAEIPPVTIILNKHAGDEPSPRLLAPELQLGNVRFLRAHVTNLKLVAPLDASANGLVVFTQDYRVERKLSEPIEHELIVEVSGKIKEGGLEQLNQGMKVSWQNETRLRFATKIFKPGLIERLCRDAGLTVRSIKRIRLGRLPLSSLPAGQWRYLTDFERF
ncbi:RNA pseudouridine synthase [Pseudoduganella sp. GCM10020061]|uniref:RNA pseudouridine synthase n=1 Tax=Pseudoduganella sp. GCM10020061 TaxID=3317345 RepID=UPI0036309AF1